MFKQNYKKLSILIQNFIKKSLSTSGFTKLLVAISGGVDSSTSLVLSVRAIGSKNVYAAILPYAKLNDLDSSLAKKLLKKLQIPKKNIIEINIKDAVDQVCSYEAISDKIRKGNIMARVRMIYLYDLSKKYNALVVGTENKTEYLLGYFTRFGDEASDIEPIRRLYKTEVFKMAAALGLSKEIIKRAPSANLWPGQSDEKEFGFSYHDADKILYLKYEKKLSTETIINSGVDRKVVKKVLKRVLDNDFKHKVPLSY